MTNETNQIGGEYLKLFFAEIEELNDFTATYKNVLVEIKAKAGQENLEKYVMNLDSEEKKRLWYQVQSVRYHVNRTSLKFAALREKVEEFTKIDEKKIEGMCEKICDTTIPDYTSVREYTKEMNKLFVTGIVSQFLEGAAPGYSSMLSKQYGGENK